MGMRIFAAMCPDEESFGHRERKYLPRKYLHWAEALSKLGSQRHADIWNDASQADDAIDDCDRRELIRETAWELGKVDRQKHDYKALNREQRTELYAASIAQAEEIVPPLRNLSKRNEQRKLWLEQISDDLCRIAMEERSIVYWHNPQAASLPIPLSVAEFTDIANSKNFIPFDAVNGSAVHGRTMGQLYFDRASFGQFVNEEPDTEAKEVEAKGQANSDKAAPIKASQNPVPSEKQNHILISDLPIDVRVMLEALAEASSNGSEGTKPLVKEITFLIKRRNEAEGLGYSPRRIDDLARIARGWSEK